MQRLLANAEALLDQYAQGSVSDDSATTTTTTNEIGTLYTDEGWDGLSSDGEFDVQPIDCNECGGGLKLPFEDDDDDLSESKSASGDDASKESSSSEDAFLPEEALIVEFPKKSLELLTALGGGPAPAAGGAGGAADDAAKKAADDAAKKAAEDAKKAAEKAKKEKAEQAAAEEALKTAEEEEAVAEEQRKKAAEEAKRAEAAEEAAQKEARRLKKEDQKARAKAAADNATSADKEKAAETKAAFEEAEEKEKAAIAAADAANERQASALKESAAKAGERREAETAAEKAKEEAEAAAKAEKEAKEEAKRAADAKVKAEAAAKKAAEEKAAADAKKAAEEKAAANAKKAAEEKATADAEAAVTDERLKVEFQQIAELASELARTESELIDLRKKFDDVSQDEKEMLRLAKEKSEEYGFPEVSQVFEDTRVGEIIASGETPPQKRIRALNFLLAAVQDDLTKEKADELGVKIMDSVVDFESRRVSGNIRLAQDPYVPRWYRAKREDRMKVSAVKALFPALKKKFAELASVFDASATEDSEFAADALRREISPSSFEDLIDPDRTSSFREYVTDGISSPIEFSNESAYGLPTDFEKLGERWARAGEDGFDSELNRLLVNKLPALLLVSTQQKQFSESKFGKREVVKPMDYATNVFDFFEQRKSTDNNDKEDADVLKEKLTNAVALANQVIAFQNEVEDLYKKLSDVSQDEAAMLQLAEATSKKYGFRDFSLNAVADSTKKFLDEAQTGPQKAVAALVAATEELDGQFTSANLIKNKLEPPQGVFNYVDKKVLVLDRRVNSPAVNAWYLERKLDRQKVAVARALFGELAAAYERIAKIFKSGVSEMSKRAAGQFEVPISPKSFEASIELSKDTSSFDAYLAKIDAPIEFLRDDYAELAKAISVSKGKFNTALDAMMIRKITSAVMNADTRKKFEGSEYGKAKATTPVARARKIKEFFEASEPSEASPDADSDTSESVGGDKPKPSGNTNDGGTETSSSGPAVTDTGNGATLEDKAILSQLPSMSHTDWHNASARMHHDWAAQTAFEISSGEGDAIADAATLSAPSGSTHTSWHNSAARMHHDWAKPAAFPFSCGGGEEEEEQATTDQLTFDEGSASDWMKRRTQALIRMRVAIYRGSGGLREAAAADLDEATRAIADLALNSGLATEQQARSGLSALNDANQLSVEEFAYDNQANAPIIMPGMERFYANRNDGARTMADSSAFAPDSDNGLAARASNDTRVIDFLVLLFGGDKAEATKAWRGLRKAEDAAGAALIAGGESAEFNATREEATLLAYGTGERVELIVRQATETRVDLFDEALYDEEYTYEDAPESACPEPVRTVCAKPARNRCPEPVRKRCPGQSVPLCGDAYGDDESRYLADTDDPGPEDDVDYEPLRQAFGKFNRAVQYEKSKSRVAVAETIGSSVVAQLIRAGGKDGDEPHVFSTICVFMLRSLFDAMQKSRCVTVGTLRDMVTISEFFEAAAATAPASEKTSMSAKSSILDSLVRIGDKVLRVDNSGLSPTIVAAGANLRAELLEQALSGPWRDAGSDKFFEVAQGAPLYIADFVRLPDVLIDTVTGLLMGVKASLAAMDPFKANFIVSEWDSAAKYTKMILSRYEGVMGKVKPSQYSAPKPMPKPVPMSKPAPVPKPTPVPVVEVPEKPVVEETIDPIGEFDLSAAFIMAAQKAN